MVLETDSEFHTRFSLVEAKMFSILPNDGHNSPVRYEEEKDGKKLWQKQRAVKTGKLFQTGIYPKLTFVDFYG